MKRLTILLLAVLVLGACSDGDDAAPDTTTVADAPAVTDPNAIRSELPEEFPVPVPDGADVQHAARQEVGDQFNYGALIKFEEGRYDELVAFYDDFTEGLDGIERNATSTEREGVTWRNLDTGLHIAVSQTVESVTLAITVPPGAL